MKRFRMNANGTYDALDGRRAVLKRARGRVSYRLASGETRTTYTTAQRDDMGLTGGDAQIAFALTAIQDSLLLRVENTGSTPIRLEELVLLECDVTKGGGIQLAPARDLLYFHHGWQSWSPTLVRRMTEAETIFEGDDFLEKHLPYGAPAANERTSHSFTLIGESGSEAAMLLGFVSGAHQFGMIRWAVGERVDSIAAIAFADGIVLEPGSALESERLLVAFGDAGTLYEMYATRAADMVGRRGALQSLQGWCSWYYYYDQLDARAIRENVNVMAAQALPLDLVIVDDGYETAVGDWTSIDVAKFPDGMKQMADEIHAAGRKAGIWVAPFGAGENSELLRLHPEFVLRNKDDAPVRAWTHAGNLVYALDLTRTDVQAWLRELFHTICFEWGYDAVKLDFVFAGALPGKHADVHSTRAQAYRLGLHVIAETLGAEKIMLGCGAPMLASVGLVDSMRVSQDVNIVWDPFEAANGGAPSTRLAVQNTLLRAPLNQKWWMNDGDCVMLRARGDVCMLSRHEVRTLAAVAALTGSVVLDSDNLANLKPSAFNDLRRLLPAAVKTARVRKWFADADALPREMELALQDGTWVLAVINWQKRTRETVIELPQGTAWRVYDFWRKKDLGVYRKRIKIAKHAPHEAIVLHCVPARSKSKPAFDHIAGK